MQARWRARTTRWPARRTFGAHLGQRSLCFEDFEFEQLAPAELVAQRELQLVECGDALQHAGLDPVRGIGHLALRQCGQQFAHGQTQPRLDGAQQVIPIAHGDI